MTIAKIRTGTTKKYFQQWISTEKIPFAIEYANKMPNLMNGKIAECSVRNSRIIVAREIIQVQKQWIFATHVKPLSMKFCQVNGTKHSNNTFCWLFGKLVGIYNVHHHCNNNKNNKNSQKYTDFWDSDVVSFRSCTNFQVSYNWLLDIFLLYCFTSTPCFIHCWTGLHEFLVSMSIISRIAQ